MVARRTAGQQGSTHHGFAHQLTALQHQQHQKEQEKSSSEGEYEEIYDHSGDEPSIENIKVHSSVGHHRTSRGGNDSSGAPQSPLKKTLQHVTHKVTEVRRKLITGDRRKRVRDFVKEAPVVRLIDRVSFFLGVVTFGLTDFILASVPHYFQWWFLAVMPLLIAIRIPVYTGLKYKYFLYDFCYAVNALCVVSMFFNQSVTLRRLVFVLANGPLSIAVLAWRNSLVFHSLDKVTSLFLHVFPSLLTYCWRWHSDSSDVATVCPDGLANCPLDSYSYLGAPLLGYFIWQALYLVKTEIVDRKEIKADPKLWTSSRWMTQRPNAMRSLALIACKKLSVLAPDETFNSEHWKTKIVFIIAQFLYTLITMLPTKLLWEYHFLHAGFIIFCLLISIWNGAQFYIEVFASTYQSKLNRSGT